MADIRVDPAPLEELAKYDPDPQTRPNSIAGQVAARIEVEFALDVIQFWVPAPAHASNVVVAAETPASTSTSTSPKRSTRSPPSSSAVD